MFVRVVNIIGLLHRVSGKAQMVQKYIETSYLQ